jgi:antitoxin component YwqK of YwqJK toxin-antitoxin module
MNRLFFLLLLLTSIGCGEKKKDPFNQSNYILVKTDSFKGSVGTQYLVYKYDTLRKLQIDYWGDGKLMARSFFYNGKMDGEAVIYDYKGNLMAIDSFKNGVKVYEKLFFEKDTSIKLFKNGKLGEFKSIDSLTK